MSFSISHLSLRKQEKGLSALDLVSAVAERSGDTALDLCW
jgi:hypothetical protein